MSITENSLSTSHVQLYFNYDYEITIIWFFDTEIILPKITKMNSFWNGKINNFNNLISVRDRFESLKPSWNKNRFLLLFIQQKKETTQLKRYKKLGTRKSNKTKWNDETRSKTYFYFWILFFGQMLFNLNSQACRKKGLLRYIFCKIKKPSKSWLQKAALFFVFFLFFCHQLYKSTEFSDWTSNTLSQLSIIGFLLFKSKNNIWKSDLVLFCTLQLSTK